MSSSSKQNPDPTYGATHPKAVAYWKKNLIVLSVLLTVWFTASFLLSIVFAAPLNEWKLGGFPLGFWMAQQGSIFVFIVLILIYALVMRYLDRHYDVHEE